MLSRKLSKLYLFLFIQDHLTKFVVLKPLPTKETAGVAEELVRIFCLFGSPCILQSDNGREFVSRMITEVAALWPGCKIVHGKPRHSQSQGSVERANQDVENILACWMKDNNTDRWASCPVDEEQQVSFRHKPHSVFGHVCPESRRRDQVP